MFKSPKLYKGVYPKKDKETCFYPKGEKEEKKLEVPDESNHTQTTSILLREG
jgi:hypothetical protein